MRTDYENYYSVEDQLRLRNKDLDAAIIPMIGDAQNILDAGCGAGELALKLKNMGKKVFCIDVKQEYVDNMKKLGFKARRLDISRKLPFKDKSFDLVICEEVLEHLKNPGIALKEFFRIAKNVLFTLPRMHPDEWHLWMVNYKEFSNCIVIKMEERK